MLLAQKNSVRQGFIWELVGSRILLTPGTWHSGHKGKPFDLCESGVFFCRTALPLATMNAWECVVPDIYRRQQMQVERRQQFIGGQIPYCHCWPSVFLIQKAASNWRTSTLFTYCEWKLSKWKIIIWEVAKIFTIWIYLDIFESNLPGLCT